MVGPFRKHAASTMTAPNAQRLPTFTVATQMKRIGDPRSLIEQAAERVPNSTLQFTLGFLLFYGVCAASGSQAFVWHMPLHPEPWIPVPDLAALFVVVLGLVTFGIARGGRLSRQSLVDLHGLYEVIVCFGVALFENWSPWMPGELPRSAPISTILIMVFPLVVPSTAGRQFISALAAACMTPLAMYIGIRFNNGSLPDPGAMVIIYGSLGIAVLLAAFPSNAVHNSGYRQVASRLGSYTLQNPLGKGGMGEVWQARHDKIARPAAVKFVKPEALGANSPIGKSRLADRFEREARVIAGLRSPHTVQLYDFGIADDGTLYYVMEYLDGLSLDELVGLYGPLPVNRAIHMLRQVCLSLEEAHQLGLIHRDIKPANLQACMYGTEFDFIKVLDFGLVSAASDHEVVELSADGEVLITGTPAFVSPEVVAHQPIIDARADIYGVGCVAFWLLTGTLVFDAKNPSDIMAAHLHLVPPLVSECTSTSIPLSLERLIDRCLAKSPSQRPSSVLELVRELDAIIAGGDVLEWTRADAERWWQVEKPNLDRALQPGHYRRPDPVLTNTAACRITSALVLGDTLDGVVAGPGEKGNVSKR
jgi:eukaryotic-like serine/threonine-protein kinase